MVAMKWVVALTCVAAALALPVAEDAIVRETTPITIMTQDPASIASAQAAASANASAAVAAEAAEKKWTEQEAQFVNSTKALNKAARDAQRKAVADNAQAAKDLADEEAAVTAKVAEANKGDAEAEAEYDKLQAEYKQAIEDSKVSDKKASAKTEARAAQYKHEMDTVKAELSKEEAEGKAAHEKLKSDAAALKKEQETIADSYNHTMADLAAQGKADQQALADDKAAMSAQLRKWTKGNATKAKAEQDALAAEKEKNAQNAADEKKKIDDTYAAIKAQQDEANALWKKKQDEAAAATNAARENTQKKFLAAENADNAKYAAAMANASALQAKADHAQKVYEEDMAAGEKEQAETDAITKHELDSGNEIAMCAMGPPDGPACLNTDGSCTKVNDIKGPYMDHDLVSCTNVKPAEQPYAGTSWAGVPPPPPLAPFPKPTEECKSLTAQFKAGKWGFAMDGSGMPAVKLACAKIPDNHLSAQREGLMDYFDVAAACPPYCLPGTATSDGLNPATYGICIRGEDVQMFKAQIADLPQWGAMGTNMKYKAENGIISICQMAKNFVQGFKDGVNTPP
jgi:hypothetical protein